MTRMGLPFEFDLEVLAPFKLENEETLETGVWSRGTDYSLTTINGDYRYLASCRFGLRDDETHELVGRSADCNEFDIVHGVACGRFVLISALDERWPDEPSVSFEAALKQLVSNVHEFRRLAGYTPTDIGVLDARYGADPTAIISLPPEELPPPVLDLQKMAEPTDPKTGLTAGEQAELQKMFDSAVAEFSAKTGSVSGPVHAGAGGVGFNGTAKRLLMDLNRSDRMVLVWNALLKSAGAFEGQEFKADYRRGLIAYGDGKCHLTIDQADRMLGEKAALKLQGSGYEVSPRTRVGEIARQVFREKLSAVVQVKEAMLQEIANAAQDERNHFHVFAIDLLEGGAEGGASKWGQTY